MQPVNMPSPRKMKDCFFLSVAELAIIVTGLDEYRAQMNNHLCPEFEKDFPDSHAICKKTVAEIDELKKKLTGK